MIFSWFAPALLFGGEIFTTDVLKRRYILVRIITTLLNRARTLVSLCRCGYLGPVWGERFWFLSNESLLFLYDPPSILDVMHYHLIGGGMFLNELLVSGLTEIRRVHPLQNCSILLLKKWAFYTLIFYNYSFLGFLGDRYSVFIWNLTFQSVLNVDGSSS